MLKTSEIEIKMIGKNKQHYSNLGYDISGEFIFININDLPKNSGRMVDCICDDCNKDMKMTYQNYNIGISKNGKTICKKCIRNYVINPFSKQEIKDKIKNTLMEKYGFDHPSKIKEIKDKRDRTMIERYGSAYSFNNETINNKRIEKIEKRTDSERKLIVEKSNNNRDKIKSRLNFEKTMLDKYGVSNALQNENIKKKMIEKINKKSDIEKEKIKEKIKDKCLKSYGFEYPMQSELLKNKSKDTKRKNSTLKFIEKHNNLKVFDIDYDNGTIKSVCDKHGEYSIGISVFYHRWRENHNLCIKCNKLGSYTKTENDLLDFIKKNYEKEILIHNRKILNNELELDIYLPELKIAFEFNGLYWHSELYKPNNYHLNKTEMCENQEIHLIHIYEDDWLHKQNIVKSRIINLLGKSEKIYARKCTIKTIDDNKLVREFLEKNHLQGFVGSKIKIGLFYNEELVSLMTFGSYRISMNKKSKDNSYELLRFCNKLNTNVVGGASRLFKYFIDNYKPNEVISYADRSWSTGNLYEKLGFSFLNKTKPNYYYILNGIRNYRFNYRKDKLVKNGSDPNKTEHEIMLDKKIYRIYDSGSLKFIL